MKVLMVTPEVAPLVKVGGLADVVGALPKALAAQGHDVRIVCPGYGGIPRDRTWVGHDRPLTVRVGSEDHYAKIWETVLPGSQIPVYLLEYDAYFGRWEVYDGPWGPHGDNDRRFAFLSRGAIDLCPWLGWIPDVFHGHDWAAGLLPVYLNTTERPTALGNAASVLTIHNLQHQGYCDPSIIDFARLPWEVFRPDGLESMGAVNLLKGGLYHATKITTVSPAYAREIQTEAGGAGLHDVLSFRSADLVGILNGIDEEAWDPSRDAFLPARYEARDLHGKALCKDALQRAMGLEPNPQVPVFGVVSRLYEQKGLDLFQEIIPALMAQRQVQVAILGTGDAWLEEAFCGHAHHFGGRVGVATAFSESLAHLVYGGSDFFVMPSRFEPCGLGQMYAMRYGAPPVVRATGGLVDTVTPYDEADGSGLGFCFGPLTTEALLGALELACATWYDRPKHYASLQKRGMKEDFSWGRSAGVYGDLYGWALDARLGVEAAG